MIIFFETVEIRLQDIPKVLRELGYAVQSVDMQIRMQVFCRETCDRIVELLCRSKAEYAISYNFSETISQACMEADVPYISWVYDNPQQELYSQYAHYPNNYIFVFDKIQQKRLKQIGLKHVYHMPLAAYGANMINALCQSDKYAGKYEADIAFVGQLYRIENIEKIIEQADIKIQLALEECIADCFLNWNRDVSMTGTMPDICVQYFSEVDGHKVAGRYPYVTEQFYYEAAVLSRVLANRERVTILNELAEAYDVRFYTFDKDVKNLSDKVKVYPGAKYDTEVANVYSQSKINLNITLHCIEKGISQRVFDVMAAGGFLLTNYQEELEEWFVPGEDLVIWHNMEELHYYIAYYLTHEEERQRIAANGQKKVLEYHDLHMRMSQVMQMVADEELLRTESYLDMWKALEIKTEMMKDLVLCHNVEIQLGVQQIFQGIENWSDANDKYYDVWECLQETDIASEEIHYTEFCRLICEKEICGLYIVWHMYVKKDDGERILLKLCDYMKRYSIALAIELVSYGLIMTPCASALLLKKAECLMEVSMWREALDTLKKIENPQNEIVLLIQKLEKLFGM